MKASRLKTGLRVCVLALCLCMTPLAIQTSAQNNSGSSGSTQSTSQTTTTTTQASQPAQQTTRVVTREASNNQTIYWIIGFAVLALVVIVAIVAMSKRSRNEA